MEHGGMKQFADKDLFQSAGLIAFSAFLFFLSDSSATVAKILQATGTLWTFLDSIVIATIVICLLFAFDGALSGNTPFRHTGLIGGLLTLIGMVGALIAYSRGATGLLPALFGTIFGIGFGTLGMRWGIMVCELDEARFAKLVPLACIVSALFKIVLQVIPTGWISAILMVLIVIASIAPSGEPKSPAVTYPPCDIERVKGLPRRTWVLLVTFLCSISIYVMAWDMILGSSSVADIMTMTNTSATGIGALIAGILLAVFLPNRHVSTRKNTMGDMLPLFCIALLLFVWFIGAWEKGLGAMLGLGPIARDYICNIPIGFSVVTIGVLLFQRLSLETEGGLAPSFSVGLLISISSGFFLIYALLQSMAGLDIGSGIDLTLRLACLAICTAYLIIHPSSRPVEAASTTTDFDGHLEEFGSSHGLSKRETEILSLLVQGHSAPYIADLECISINTVKTHIKRIYTKTNAHTREELLEAVHTNVQ